MVDRSWDSYLSKTTSRRDFHNVYTAAHRSRGRSIRSFFVNASNAIENIVTLRFIRRLSDRSISSKSYVSSIREPGFDLSTISSDETFVIAGTPPSKFSRFWRRFKAVFKDDKPRVPYNSHHQFSIRGEGRPSAAVMARQRRRELADSVDLSAIAATIEKGRIK